MLTSLSKPALLPDLCLLHTAAGVVTPFWLLVLVKPCKSVFVPVQKSVLPRTVNLLPSSVDTCSGGEGLSSAAARL